MCFSDEEIAEACSKSGIRPEDLRKEYRAALAAVPKIDPGGYERSKIVDALPPYIHEALGWLGVIGSYDNEKGDRVRYIQGYHPHRYTI